MARPGSGMSSTPPPNYVNPPTRPPAVQVTSILFGVLVTLSLGLRLYTRGYIRRHFELDDLFAFFATLLTDTSFILQVYRTVVLHQDRHTWDIPPNELYDGQKVAFIYIIIFAEAACQSKLSLLFFSRKMIGVAKYGNCYPQYICVMTLITVVALCQVLFVVVSCIECRPLKAAWDPRPTYPYKCFNTGIYLSITGIINTLTDFLCTILPAFIVMKLQMPLRKRIGVASLFLVGIFVNIASALRIYYFYYQFKTSDSWNYLQASVCSNLELGLGLLCVNIPTLRPFVTHYHNHAKSYIRSFSDKPNYYANADNSRHSETLLPPEDGVKSAISAENASETGQAGPPLLQAWRGKAGADADAIEVSRTIELRFIQMRASEE